MIIERRQVPYLRFLCFASWANSGGRGPSKHFKAGDGGCYFDNHPVVTRGPYQSTFARRVAAAWLRDHKELYGGIL